MAQFLMKKASLKKNTVYYSTRFSCFGQCLQINNFMAYMIWTKPTAPPGWYHCAELVYDISEIKP